MTSKLGIIQSRGLGDILIALPIAEYYHREGYEVYWPICDEFFPSVKDSVPWVHWIPLVPDSRGLFFYDTPRERLRNLGVKPEDILCLYQSLSSQPELSSVPWFQIQSFDQFKYTRAGVPFLNKWRLKHCLQRDLDREQTLYDRLVQNEHYYVTHFQGSSYTAEPDLSYIPQDWQRIDVDENRTESIFDWLTVLSKATAIICVDSAVSNLVDQMQILGPDLYWIPRSHIHLTPILGSSWTVLDPPPGTLAAQKIWGSSR